MDVLLTSFIFTSRQHRRGQSLAAWFRLQISRWFPG